MVAAEVAAIGPTGEDATEEARRSEAQAKDSINHNQGNCEPVIKSKPIRHPNTLEQVQTTTNIATEEQNHHGYELDTVQITMPDYHTL